MSFYYENSQLRVKELSTEGPVTFTEPNGTTNNKTVTVEKLANTKNLRVDGNLFVTGITVTPILALSVYKNVEEDVLAGTSLLKGITVGPVAYNGFINAPGLQASDVWTSNNTDGYFTAPLAGMYRICFTMRAEDENTDAAFKPYILDHVSGVLKFYLIKDLDNSFFIPLDNFPRRMAHWSTLTYMEPLDQLHIDSTFETYIKYVHLDIQYVGGFTVN